jgi:hypothetical protein
VKVARPVWSGGKAARPYLSLPTEDASVGSHIEAYFPHTVARSPEAVRKRLAQVFGDRQDDLTVIRERGRFSSGSGDWRLAVDEDGTVRGEGPSGFLITVYPAVIEFTSLERFGAVERPEQGIHAALRRVFEGVAAAFGAGGRLAVAAGGYGDTDRARDLAAAGREFAEVCECLAHVAGVPARSWEALETGPAGWYLGGVAERGAGATRGR